MNLFSRLYRYQSSDLRSQLENYCTESLCYILNQLTQDETAKLLTKLALPYDLVDHIQWQTQYTILDEQQSRRYPDLVGLINNNVRYLIEVKIDATFTVGFDCDSNIINQLEIYDRWLANNKIEGQEVALILLTSKTLPCADFTNLQSDKFNVKQRKVIYWQAIYDALRQISSNSLINEFGIFLKERGLAMDLPTSQDFAIMNLWLNGSGQRIELFMQDIFVKIKQKYASVTPLNWSAEDKYRYRGNKFYWGAGMSWSWVMLNQPPYQYFYWGILYPEHGSIWNIREEFPHLPHSPQFIFGYVAQDEQFVDQILSKFSAHQYHTGLNAKNEESTIFVNSLPIDTLLADNYNLDTVVNWLSNEIDQALAILKST